MVEVHIRATCDDYRKALEREARRYALYAEYYFTHPFDGWDSSKMGELPQAPSEEAHAESFPRPPPLLRHNRLDRIIAFKTHYRNSFNSLLKARAQLKAREQTDCDVHNIISVVHELCRAFRRPQLGKSEIVSTMISFVRPTRVPFHALARPISRRRSCPSL